MKTIKLINGTELPIFEVSEPTAPCTDLDLFVANVHNIIANGELIFSDSRIFMCPIDMDCTLTISGKFAPTTLGAYLEWWLNYNESSDSYGNPIVRLTGSAVSEANNCVAADIDGNSRNITLFNGFSAAYKTFLKIRGKYEEYIGNCEAYSFEQVLKLFAEKDASREISDLKGINAQLSVKLEAIRRKHIALEKLYQEKTDEYLAAILEPHVEEAKRLYSTYREIEEYSDALAHEHYAAKRLAYQQFRDDEITQKEYVAIRNREFEKIHEIRDKQHSFWMEHFTALYHKNAKYFTPKSIGRFLDKK